MDLIRPFYVGFVWTEIQNMVWRPIYTHFVVSKFVAFKIDELTGKILVTEDAPHALSEKFNGAVVTKINDASVEENINTVDNALDNWRNETRVTLKIMAPDPARKSLRKSKKSIALSARVPFFLLSENQNIF